MRNIGLIVLVSVMVVGCRAPEPTPTDRLTMAAEYLWSQQAEDGGWHSETHGLLRGGQAWTPFVLHALLQVPDEVYRAPDSGVERGLTFMRDRINQDGVLGLADSMVLEYPNYATAYALLVFAEHGEESDSLLVNRMSEYLEAQQFTEQRGMDQSNLAYGAWGFGETNLAEGQTGHVDLSHTRRALQAIRSAGLVTDSTYAAARTYLRFIQKRPNDERPQPPGDLPADSAIYDGGFYASPVSVGVNKGGTEADETGEPAVYRSYASATADGILALLAAGFGVDDSAVRDAVDWLRDNPDWAVPAGIPTDDPAQWQRVMLFYHIAARAEAYSALDESGTWRANAFDIIAPLQHADGHFANPDGAPNKEDDPILATAMMVETLVRIAVGGAL